MTKGEKKMTGYQKIKEQYEAMKKSRNLELHRASVYLLAMMANIEKDSDLMKKIQESAKVLFNNYQDENHDWDPLIKL